MSRTPDPIDQHVAQRLKLRRELAGLSQDKLGAAVGVSFQMIQKYEHGTSRVGAGRLMKIAKVLEVPVSWFFEGFKGVTPAGGLAQNAVMLDDSLLHKKETLDLLKAYYALPEPLRKHVLGMVQGFNPAVPAAPTAPLSSEAHT